MLSSTTKIPPSTRRVVLFSAFILLVVWSRIDWLDAMSFDLDEVRSSMRASGTVAQIIAWQPEDWPPLYNVLLGVWQRLTSAHPVTLRYSSLLVFLPALALMFQSVRRITNSERAAWSATLAYGAFAYSTFLSLYLRAYTLALLLLPLLLLLTHAYFNSSRRWRLLLPLSLVIAGLFYTTYTSIFAFVWIGLYTLLFYPRRILHWVLPVGLSFLFVLPELLNKATIFQDRLNIETAINFVTPSLSDVYQHVLAEVVGEMMWIWGVVLLIALAGTWFAWRKQTRLLLWGLLWVGVAPLLLYLLLDLGIYYFLSVRYIWWILTGSAILLGVALSVAPRGLWWVSNALLIVLMFASFSNDPYPEKNEHYEDTFIWLAENIQSGDAVVIDPNICHIGCFDYDRWVYYEQVFLARQLEIVAEPAQQQRVWYVHSAVDFDETVQASVASGRLRGQFGGPTGFLFQLWQAPPDPEGVLFGDYLRFHGLEWIDDAQETRGLLFPEQTTTRVRLWWSVEDVPPRPYSVSIQLIDETGTIIVQDDQSLVATYLTPVFFEPLPDDMTGWEPNEFYVEERTLTIPSLTDKVWTDVFLVVYQWWDGKRLNASGVNGDNQLPVDEVGLLGW